MSASELDAFVAAARQTLRARRVPDPRALAWLGTGTAAVRERLSGAVTVACAELDAPPPWDASELCAGTLAGAPVWLVEPPEQSAAAAPWHRALPCWLAAAAGARTFVVTAAGAALPDEAGAVGFPAGTVLALEDHVNLSGATPLTALGASRLGPLFPDQTTLHDKGLRAAAVREARALGLAADVAVAACAPGPALETPAERRYFARAGAGVSVQGLADPLIAAAHAGLVGVALVAVADVGARPVDLASLAATASAMTPGIAELVAALAPDLARRAAERDQELSA